MLNRRVLVCLGLITLLSCSPSKKEPSQNVLTVQLRSEPISLDPAQVEDGMGLQLVTQIREGLVGYDGKGQLQNELAQSYSISADGKRYEFTLKPNLSWSDGKPLEPSEFVYGLWRAIDPKTAGKIGDELLLIRGAHAFRAGKIHPKAGDHDLGVFVENGKVVIELEEPASYFIHALALPGALPVREDLLLENEGKWVEGKQAGTGPYRFAAYQQGKRLLLEANPYYWRGKPAIPLVDCLFVENESTAINLFETGRLDIVTRVSGPEVGRLRAKGSLRQNPFFATYYIAFNTRKPPFDNRDFRRAVAGSLKREELARSLETGESPARSWIPQGLEGYIPYSDPAPVFADSVKRVKPKAPSVKGVQASFDSSERNSMVMQKIQHDLLSGLGLKVELQNMDWKSYVQSIQTSPTSIYRMAWLSPIADPIAHLQVFTTGNLSNYTGWGNSRYDALVAEISRLALGAERDRKIAEAQKLLVDDEAPLVPVYHYVQNHLVSPRVKGFSVNPFGVIPLAELSFTP